MRRLIGVTEKGHRVGEDNPAAKLTDSDVDTVFQLRDIRWGYGRIAKKMDCSKALVQKICQGRTRSQRPARFKRV